MKELFDINEAIIHLKNKEILLGVNKTFFAYKNGKIAIFNDTSNYHLNMDDFINLYKDNKFVIYEDNGVVVDVEKDNQYYNEFKHK